MWTTASSLPTPKNGQRYSASYAYDTRSVRIGFGALTLHANQIRRSSFTLGNHVCRSTYLPPHHSPYLTPMIPRTIRYKRPPQYDIWGFLLTTSLIGSRT